MDLLDCGSPTRCAECHHFVDARCALAAALRDALPSIRALEPAPAAPAFGYARSAETWQSVLVA